MTSKAFLSPALLVVAAASVFAVDIEHECSTLVDLRLPDVRITGAVSVHPESEPGATSRHCKVTGTIGREINFELLLPDEWNGNFFMGGGGGYVGSVTNSAASTVDRGYATVGTDTGHQDNGLSASWALNNAERQVNFGHLAIHRTAEVSKAVLRHYYGAQPEYSYFFGCSRGGGQALMAAQRYPDDFDGIVSAAPAFDWTSFMAAMIQNVELNYPDSHHVGTAVISTANLELLEAAVLEQCDARDGVEDGVMEDPRDCDFDLASIQACVGEDAADDCLTGAQRAAIDRIYAPAKDPRKEIHPGWTFGGEGHAQGWKLWIGGPNGPMANLHFAFSTEFFKYFVYGDPDWDYSHYDFTDWEKDSRFAASLLNATDPDLSAFREHGGKLIAWHGWSDPALSALQTIDYYEEAGRLDPDLSDYFRLFMLPGVLHCAGGPGPDSLDWFEVIADWVENDNAPNRLIASKMQDGDVVRTRPLCPYPQRAIYRGSGSPDDAGNFRCEAPH